MRQHLVFVYGTLRPGTGQLPAAARRPHDAGGSCDRRGSRDVRQRVPICSCPARCPGCDLITITPELYRDVLTDLDHLEGYYPSRPGASHYIRKARSVVAMNRTPNGGTWEAFHTAWIYIAGPDIEPSRMPRITDDDWLAPTG